MFEKMLDSKNIELKLNQEFTKDMTKNFDKIFYSGSIDEFFNYKYGKLPYRSLNFEFETKDCEYFQPAAMVNYPNNNSYTRIIEHKYFLDEKSDKTVISKEYPKAFEIGKNERYYPIKNVFSQNLYKKYREEAKKYNNIHFIGRLGAYKYINMDETVEEAMKIISYGEK